MRALLTVAALVVIGLLTFNYLSTGELRLLPATASAEEQRLEDLQADFAAARSAYRQAERAAGVSGMDTTADAAATLRELDRIEERLDDLRASLSGDQRAAADRLAREIDELKRRLR